MGSTAGCAKLPRSGLTWHTIGVSLGEQAHYYGSPELATRFGKASRICHKFLEL